jgi:hypothetical protein
MFCGACAAIAMICLDVGLMVLQGRAYHRRLIFGRTLGGGYVGSMAAVTLGLARRRAGRAASRAGVGKDGAKFSVEDQRRDAVQNDDDDRHSGPRQHRRRQ